MRIVIGSKTSAGMTYRSIARSAGAIVVVVDWRVTTYHVPPISAETTPASKPAANRE